MNIAQRGHVVYYKSLFTQNNSINIWNCNAWHVWLHNIQTNRVWKQKEFEFGSTIVPAFVQTLISHRLSNMSWMIENTNNQRVSHSYQSVSMGIFFVTNLYQINVTTRLLIIRFLWSPSHNFTVLQIDYVWNYCLLFCIEYEFINWIYTTVIM